MGLGKSKPKQPAETASASGRTSNAWGDENYNQRSHNSRLVRPNLQVRQRPGQHFYALN